MKKLIALLIVAAIAFTGSAVYAACNGVCGDFNNDGQLNVGDIVTLGYCMYTNPFDPVCATYNWNCADFDGNGSTTVEDLDAWIAFIFQQGPEPACW